MAELSSSQGKTFLSINGNGKLAKKATAETEGAVKNIYNAGKPDEKTVYQLEYKAIKGMITGMYYNKHEQYGESLNVIIDDEYALQLKVGSRYYYSFVKTLPNLDFAQPVTFNPWRKEKPDGKISAALYLNQGGGKDSVKWYFTQETPNGMPEMKKVTFKGEEKWDDTDMQVFCKKFVEEKILPKFGNRTANTTSGNITNTGNVATANTPAADTSSNYQVNNDADDLPF